MKIIAFDIKIKVSNIVLVSSDAWDIAKKCP
jgi:hypothetical protein